ncbi:Vacuolar protein-sorting-associated protein 27 [Maudiozyma exigua]|uniref:Vacuolar protein sorting-associated protein 27 n=1 Tax=Maudiozyma exigua TaxID=34358 RepID=A0A9P6W5H3_MAUEX|nr:Vacuolar protein-sorting-associated protein 27 [Kazachstania exigua]
MSTYTTSEFDLLVQKSTSESIPNGELDLPVALEISDIIRSRKLPPLDCMRCLKKRISSTLSNPNTQLSSWKLLDVCIKNGGTPFIVTICSREFMDTIEHTIIRLHDNGSSMDDDELYELVTKIFYELYVAFKNDSQLHYVSTVYGKLKSRGIQFPEHLFDSNSPMIMFDSKTPADWVESDACMICSKKFSMLNRRHHCRSCGGIFCQEHSSHTIPLPDLGITEEVRVCDNCFEDYDMKKRNNGKGDGDRKKKHSKKHNRKHKDGDYDEDEQLRRAIQLSLQDNNAEATKPIIPVVEPEHPSHNDMDMEEDPDLKAAIEASLREAEAVKTRQSQTQPIYAQPETQTQQPTNNNELSTAEEEDIYLFASLVERMKTQSVTDLLEDTQLQQLYQKVIATKPKVNYSLNDKINKYNTLIDMNSKISDIMNIYDSLLEQQLRNINISQQYNLPQQPSDPYAVTQPLPQPQAPVHVQQPQQQYIQPVNPTLDQVPSQPVTQALSQAQAQAQAQVPTPVQSISDTPLSTLPSEPPYPEDEDEKVPAQSTNAPNQMKSDTIVSNGTNLPYPSEPVEQALQTQEVKKPNNIMTFDFPAVPANRLPTTNNATAEQPVENKIEEPQEEELLLEL